MSTYSRSPEVMAALIREVEEALRDRPSDIAYWQTLKAWYADGALGEEPAAVNVSWSAEVALGGDAERLLGDLPAGGALNYPALIDNLRRRAASRKETRKNKEDSLLSQLKLDF